MKKLGIIFTLCLVLTFLIVGATVAGSARADDRVLGKDNAGSMTFTLYTSEYAITQDKQGLDVVQMEGFSSTTSPGDPMLFHKVYNIAVPPDIVWSSLKLNVVSVETRMLEGSYDIRPAPPILPGTNDTVVEEAVQKKETINDRNMEVYGTDADFPESYLELLPYSQMRKWKYTSVDFTPFQYNPVSRKLTLIESVTIEITYEQSGIKPQAKLMNDTVMDDVAAQVFFNYQQVKSMYRPGAIVDATSVTYDYVIITTNAIEANSTKLASFISHKESQGHSVLVITEDEFGGLAGQSPNHKAEKIRKWLIDNYAAMGIEYVLLIGDPHPYESGEGDIPMKMCHPEMNQTEYPECEPTPTDYFYADLTGNWDHDGDGYYGEWADDYPVSGGVDFAPEVYVGRIPVYGADYSTLDSILQKIIDYETEASIDWRKSALLPMGFQSAGYDGAPLAEQMRDDYLNAAGFSSWRMYQQGNGTCGLDSTYTSDEELRGGTVVKDRWAASDYGIVCWWGHGNQISTAVGYTGCWDGTLFHSSYCSSLDDDHPSFTYQCSCTNGYPEHSDNLQYAILKQGGIGTVSATRVSWFNYGVGYGEFDGSPTNSGIGYEYVSRLVSDNPAGQALYSTKQSMTPDDQCWLMNWYDFNLYGDPTTSLASQGGEPDITVSPTSFEVTLPPDTTQDYTLTIGNDGDGELAYTISDRTTGGGGPGGSESLLLEPASMMLEVPLESSPVEPENSGEAQAAWQNIMTEDFEGAFPTGLWAAFDNDGATNGEYYWDDDDYKPHGGSWSAWCANGGVDGLDPEFYYYPNNMKSWMVYGPFDLSDATDAELNFYCWLQSQTTHDYLWWAASTNGSNFYGWGTSGDSGGWVSQSFDLTTAPTLGNLCGEAEVWIAFVFTSDHSIFDEGAFIDDIELRKYVGSANTPPNTPSNPSPTNHATDVSVNADLNWTGGDPDVEDTVTYDVYLDTTGATTLVFNNQSGTTYDPGTLSHNTTYYWKIVATDNHTASTTGPVWDFTTAAEDCPWLSENLTSGTIGPAASHNITVSINTTGLGSNYTAEIVIASNDPDENPITVPVTLHVRPELPDLVVSKSIEFSGGNFTVSYNVTNIGNATANASTTCKYLNGTLEESQPCPALGPGESYNSTFDPEPCPCGESLNVTVCADNDDVVAESNETNNCEINIVDCPAMPDLVITEKSEEWVDPEAKTYNITYTVSNQGCVAAAASNTTITINGTDVLEDPAPALAAGANYSNTIGPFTMSGNSANITVCADNGDVVAESNETNNCQTNAIGLMEGDATLNGCVSIADAMFIAQYIFGLRTLSPDQLECADANDNGSVTMADAMHVAQWVFDPDGSLGVLTKPLWQSPADDDMLEPVPC